MNMEMPNLTPVQPDKKYKLPEKTVSELEGENFENYVLEVLHKKGEHELAMLIGDGKISLGLEAKKAVETGNQAERSNENFDIGEHMLKRAEMYAEELIKNKKEYLN